MLRLVLKDIAVYDIETSYLGTVCIKTITKSKNI